MVFLDYVVLVGYFAVLVFIGVLASRRIKKQEDFFLGGRSFGKLLQTFAAFGAGTGSSDPVNTGRTTFTSGMSGMWSVMYWLFVTPFYWIAGVWYRRMRHLTLGDWFVERYESRALGAGYAIFGITFFMVYGSMLFSAIGKVAAPLIDIDPSGNVGGGGIPIEYWLVPIIGAVVLAYGIAGGLEAAYFTDLIQGLCIIALSVILIPFGLQALVEKFGDPNTQSMWDGFTIMHQQIPPEYFDVVGSTTSSEFPLHRIIAVVIINLVGIVVQPHFIATGGGSAKTETNARVGLVTGNFLKRFCTIGWMLTGLVAIALYASNAEVVNDPDKAWGVASRELLGPGLRGLMLACLLAALMSSVDAYMVVGSSLIVRNLYAPYINANASEKQYVRLARITGAFVVAGAVLISLWYMDVFEQLQLTWVFPVLFAAPFWAGMYWRRATTAAAWCTVAYCALVFFLVPYFAPRMFPELRTDSFFTKTNDVVVVTRQRKATGTDVAKRQAQIDNWEKKREKLEEAKQKYAQARQEFQYTPTGTQPKMEAVYRYQMALKGLLAAQQTMAGAGEKLPPLEAGETFTEPQKTGGQAIYWSQGVKPVDENGNVLADVKPQPVGEPTQTEDGVTRQLMRYGDDVRLQGFGSLQIDLLLYQLVGMDLTKYSSAWLNTLLLPVKIVSPFLVMILISLITPRNSKPALDRYYAKMKTPVDPDREVDRRNLEAVYEDPQTTDSKKLFPGSSLEIQKPTITDIAGFLISVLICFGIIALAYAVANIS